MLGQEKLTDRTRMTRILETVLKVIDLRAEVQIPNVILHPPREDLGARQQKVKLTPVHHADAEPAKITIFDIQQTNKPDRGSISGKQVGRLHSRRTVGTISLCPCSRGVQSSHYPGYMLALDTARDKPAQPHIYKEVRAVWRTPELHPFGKTPENGWAPGLERLRRLLTHPHALKRKSQNPAIRKNPVIDRQNANRLRNKRDEPDTAILHRNRQPALEINLLHPTSSLQTSGQLGKKPE